MRYMTPTLVELSKGGSGGFCQIGSVGGDDQCVTGGLFGGFDCAPGANPTAPACTPTGGTPSSLEDCFQGGTAGICAAGSTGTGLPDCWAGGTAAVCNVGNTA